MELVLGRPKLSDYDEIVAMSRGVYEGNDYLPHVFAEWMKEEEEEGDGDSSRRSIGEPSRNTELDMNAHPKLFQC